MAELAARKYSLAEIDDMRSSVGLLHYGSSVETEAMLRTYMANGTEPEELRAHAMRALERRHEMQRIAVERDDWRAV